MAENNSDKNKKAEDLIKTAQKAAKTVKSVTSPAKKTASKPKKAAAKTGGTKASGTKANGTKTGGAIKTTAAKTTANKTTSTKTTNTTAAKTTANKTTSNTAGKATSNPAAKTTKKQGGGKGAGKRLIISLVILAILTGGFFVGLFYENQIDEALGFRTVETYNTGDMVSIGGLNVHFINVRQGDACLIELPDDRGILIDAGDQGSAVEKKLESYIKEVNEARAAALPKKPQITFFDYVIITHSHEDHVGSLPYILNLYPAATFYRPNEKSTATGFDDPAANPLLAETKHGFWGTGFGTQGSAVYKRALDAGYKQHDNFKEAIVTNPHDERQNCIKPDYPASHGLYYEVNFYGPVRSAYANVNNHSPIIIIEYQNRRIALSGDAESMGENDFVSAVTGAESGDRYYKIKNEIAQPSYYIDIIKLGHHGSDTSSTAAYLSLLTKAQYTEDIFIVISVNQEDAAKVHWTHPHPDAMARVKNAGIPDENIFRTDLNGDIFFALNFYQGQTRAFVEDSRGGPITIPDYPVLGGIIRYRNIGIAVIILLALILLPLSFVKKAEKQTKKKK